MFKSIALRRIAVPSNALSTAAVAGVLLLGAATAQAAESTVEMQRIREGGPGPVIGSIRLSDSAAGVELKFNLNELPPGPNRLFLHDAGDCMAPRGELLANPLAVVNVTTSENGAEPVKSTAVVPGRTLAEMTGRALVVHRGSQLADLGPELTAQPRLVACGIIR